MRRRRPSLSYHPFAAPLAVVLAVFRETNPLQFVDAPSDKLDIPWFDLFGSAGLFKPIDFYLSRFGVVVAFGNAIPGRSSRLALGTRRCRSNTQAVTSTTATETPTISPAMSRTGWYDA